MPLPLRRASRTLLIVGEGDTEIAFLRHVKGIYAPRGCGLSVTVVNARGKGPANVVDTVIRHCAYRSYDSRAALLDTDVPWSADVVRRATNKRIALVGSTPCLEGLLLNVLGQPVPPISADCKRILGTHFQGDPLRSEDYAEQFGRSALDVARMRVAALRELLNLLS